MAVPAQGSQDDAWLVRAVQAGDTEAFSELFRRHYLDVRRSCARRMTCPLEAEEIAQAAFVRALERIRQCSGERQFGGWVQIIARHMCVDALRSRSRVVPTESPMSEHHADGNEPHDSLLDQEQRADVRRALDTLPLRQRQAVTARALGTGPGQIAVDLGLSVGAVDSLILRGRRRLALAYRRVAGEGGATATATSATAAASLLAAFAVGSTRLLGGVAAAAEAGRDLVGPVASGVAGAIMSVAVAITGSAAPDPATVRPLPPAVVVPVPFPEAPGALAGSGTGAGSGIVTTGGAVTGASDPGLASSPAGAWPPAATTSAPAGNVTGTLAGQVAAMGGGGGIPSAPAGQTAPTPDAAAVPVVGEVTPVVEPIADTVDTAVPAVTDTVADTTEVVDDVAGDATGTIDQLLPN